MLRPAVMTAFALALAAGVPASAALQNENILVPLPEGFHLGEGSQTDQLRTAYYLPQYETQQNWTRLVTINAYKHQPKGDPYAVRATAQAQIKAACPRGKAHPMRSLMENGYPVAYWAFECPRSGRAEPQMLISKSIMGADTYYDVQYAYRSVGDRQLMQDAAAYLRRVVLCDSRRPDLLCPPGL